MLILVIVLLGYMISNLLTLYILLKENHFWFSWIKYCWGGGELAKYKMNKTNNDVCVRRKRERRKEQKEDDNPKKESTSPNGTEYYTFFAYEYVVSHWPGTIYNTVVSTAVIFYVMYWNTCTAKQVESNNNDNDTTTTTPANYQKTIPWYLYQYD